MRYVIHAVLIAAFAVAMSGCEKSKPPAPQSTGAPDSRPVQNVEALPSGTIQEGARTINKSADMGSSLEQEKQERDKEIDSQSK